MIAPVTSSAPQAVSLARRDAQQPARPEAPETPADSVSTGSDDDTSSLGYRVARGLVAGVAGTAGGVVGASIGAVQGAFSEHNILTPAVSRSVRSVACVAGLAAGVRVGMMFGPLGVVAGIVAGPIAGALAGSAAVGAADGAAASIQGAVQGAHEGGKRAYRATSHSIDILVGKDPGAAAAEGAIIAG